MSERVTDGSSPEERREEQLRREERDEQRAREAGVRMSSGDKHLTAARQLVADAIASAVEWEIGTTCVKLDRYAFEETLKTVGFEITGNGVRLDTAGEVFVTRVARHYKDEEDARERMEKDASVVEATYHDNAASFIVPAEGSGQIHDGPIEGDGHFEVLRAQHRGQPTGAPRLVVPNRQLACDIAAVIAAWTGGQFLVEDLAAAFGRADGPAIVFDTGEEAEPEGEDDGERPLFTLRWPRGMTFDGFLASHREREPDTAVASTIASLLKRINEDVNDGDSPSIADCRAVAELSRATMFLDDER